MKKFLSLLSRLALETGKGSVEKSLIWFNQPKVPKKLLEAKKK